MELQLLPLGVPQPWALKPSMQGVADNLLGLFGMGSLGLSTTP